VGSTGLGLVLLMIFYEYDNGLFVSMEGVTVHLRDYLLI